MAPSALPRGATSPPPPRPEPPAGDTTPGCWGRASRRRETSIGDGGNRTRAGRCETPSRIAPLPRNRLECLGADIWPLAAPLACVRGCWGAPSYSERPRQDPPSPSSNGGPGHASPSVHRTSALSLSLYDDTAKPKRASGPGPQARQPPASGDAALDRRGAVRRSGGFRALKQRPPRRNPRRKKGPSRGQKGRISLRWGQPASLNESAAGASPSRRSAILVEINCMTSAPTEFRTTVSPAGTCS
ncbi:hypothetical protein ATI61_101915 [Archangium gephyra]|uniref:Basic proline-rich protein n=1 Tax=Archangium gephyra TaxID=48 RepID=A0ABX9KD46_9BACT|nr:hypothetical protein ATI61_101915 [Archangium gephyra]